MAFLDLLHLISHKKLYFAIELASLSLKSVGLGFDLTRAILCTFSDFLRTQLQREYLELGTYKGINLIVDPGLTFRTESFHHMLLLSTFLL